MDSKNFEAIENFRQAIDASTDLQKKLLKVRSDADFVALGKESGYEFTQDDLSKLNEKSENEAGCGCC